MTTIVVHGTKLISGAQATSWWVDSWHPGGFLQTLSDTMTAVGGGHDVWTVGGTPVSEIQALNRSWSLWSGRSGHVSTHKGHFIWSGANMSIGRDAGADDLARYLNAIHLLTDEPLRIVAFSHGGNVVKGASASRHLAPGLHIEQTVFLACPHFYAQTAGETVFAYRLAPDRFGRILNLYTERDAVQVGLSDAITGPASARWMTWVPPEASATDPDPLAASLYDNLALEADPALTGLDAHSALHGTAAAHIAGTWLSGVPAQNLAQALGGTLPVLMPGDTGD